MFKVMLSIFFHKQEASEQLTLKVILSSYSLVRFLNSSWMPPSHDSYLLCNQVQAFLLASHLVTGSPMLPVRSSLCSRGLFQLSDDLPQN